MQRCARALPSGCGGASTTAPPSSLSDRNGRQKVVIQSSLKKKLLLPTNSYNLESEECGCKNMTSLSITFCYTFQGWQRLFNSNFSQRLHLLNQRSLRRFKSKFCGTSRSLILWIELCICSYTRAIPVDESPASSPAVHTRGTSYFASTTFLASEPGLLKPNLTKSRFPFPSTYFQRRLIKPPKRAYIT